MPRRATDEPLIAVFFFAYDSTRPRATGMACFLIDPSPPLVTVGSDIDIEDLPSRSVQWLAHANSADMYVTCQFLCYRVRVQMFH